MTKGLDALDTVYSFEKMLFKASGALGDNTKQQHILTLLTEYVEARNTLAGN
jgi:hypothetical protein